MYDLKGSVLLAGADPQLTLDAVSGEIKRCRGAIVHQTDETIEFTGPFWRLYGWFVPQLPPGIAHGVLRAESVEGGTLIRYAVSLSHLRLLACLFSQPVAVSVLLTLLWGQPSSRWLLAVLLNLGVAWGFFYGFGRLLAFFGLRRLLKLSARAEIRK